MIAAYVALFFALGPFLLALWNSVLFRTPSRAMRPASISVIIPARNEERNIGDACAAVLRNTGVTVELIVLDDHSTDGTAAILADIRDPRLRVASAPPLPAGWTGKQHACATGATLAQYELMLFIDADVRLSPDALDRIVGFMRRQNVGLGSGFPREATTGFADGLLLPLIHFLLLGFLPIAAMRRLVSPALGAGCGQMIAVRRDAYERAGGHGAVARSMHDGLMLPRAFRAAGIMTGIFDASRFAICRMYSTTGDLFEGLMKNATEGMAKPVALPVWTVLLGCGQVLPVLLVLTRPDWVSGTALLLGMVTRLLLALRFRAPVWSVVLHPLGIGGLLACTVDRAGPADPGTVGHVARPSLCTVKVAALVGGILLTAGAPTTTFLNVSVSNVRNANGHVLVAVCLPAQFLSAHCQYVGSVQAHPGTVVVRVSGIPVGTYAVEVFQDENDNMRIDRNFLGLPTEGIGFSNNASFHFGPPSFQDAAISLGAAGGEIAVRLRYFIN